MTAGATPTAALAAKRMMRTYADDRIVFTHGSGAALVDENGRMWLDFLCGLAVTSLGHAHPAVAEAIADQSRRLVHTSNLFLTTPAVELAERLARVTGWPDARTFFTQCGATANEAAIKLARLHGKRQHPDKVRVVTLAGGFHGRTLATLEATGQPEKHVPFAPLAGFVDTVEYDDAAAMTAAVGPLTAAVLVEIIQGEGGVRPVPTEVLEAARLACDQHGALLVVDEVQTGIGRCGEWFAFQQAGIEPDVITLAKALGNGMPIGACVARGAAADTFGPGDHATTFGGNPVTCAAANAVIDVIERDDLLAHAAERAAQLRDGLEALAATSPVIAGVRGVGMLVGVELDAPVAASLEQACRDRLLITNAVAADVLRLAPPLVVTADEVDLAVAAIAEAAEAVADDATCEER